MIPPKTAPKIGAIILSNCKFWYVCKFPSLMYHNAYTTAGLNEVPLSGIPTNSSGNIGILIKRELNLFTIKRSGNPITMHTYKHTTKISTIKLQIKLCWYTSGA